MFKILSDLSMILRKELTAGATVQGTNSVLASGLSGTWVTLDSNGDALIGLAGANPAWAVWNESSRDNTGGTWTPDVVNNKKVTVLCGKYFATTDRYTGSPTLGAALYIAAGGVLATAANGAIVAYCVKPQYASTTTNGTAVNVIDIYVI